MKFVFLLLATTMLLSCGKKDDKNLEEERKDGGCITNLEDAQRRSTLVNFNDLNHKISKSKDAKCRKIVKLISKKK